MISMHAEVRRRRQRHAGHPRGAVVWTVVWEGQWETRRPDKRPSRPWWGRAFPGGEQQLQWSRGSKGLALSRTEGQCGQRAGGTAGEGLPGRPRREASAFSTKGSEKPRVCVSCPVASVINGVPHTRNSLTQQEFTPSQFWRPQLEIQAGPDWAPRRLQEEFLRASSRAVSQQVPALPGLGHIALTSAFVFAGPLSPSLLLQGHLSRTISS